MNKKKVLVGMSGGIDSTVSAMLLKNEGYEVEGLYMKLHSTPGYHEIHLKRANKAAKFLGIKLHVLDLQEEFKNSVFTPFVETYKIGQTPNPCALCNRNLKFGKMIEFADQIGAYYIATGHYIKTDGKFFYVADDDSKDQSYFLFYVEQKILSRLLFPLSNKKKIDIKNMILKISEIKEFATQSESSEICFVPTVYTDVLKEYVDVDRVGEVLNRDGEVIGEHKGYMHYTIGKRRGFSVKGAHEPHFVLEIKPKTNQIVVGKRDELACNRVIINNLNMFIDEKEFNAKVKLRFRTKAIDCYVIIKDGVGYIDLEDDVYGVATGQAAVFYEDKKLLGGGWIIKTDKII